MQSGNTEKKDHDFNPFENENWPDELSLHIFSFLNPKDLVNVTATYKAFFSLASDQSIWKEKFKKHYPHLFKKLVLKQDVDWKEEFKKAYQNEYRNLTPEQKKLFYLMKEDRLNTNELDRRDLDIHDSNGFTLLDWAYKRGNEEFLQAYFIKLISTKSEKPQGSIFHSLVLCYRPCDLVNFYLSSFTPSVAPVLRLPGKNGASPLHLAARTGQLEHVINFLEKHPDARHYVNIRDNRDNTPLHVAALSGHLEIVMALLEKSADIDYVNYKGKTALYIAAANGHPEIAKALLEKGAKINKADFNNETPLYIAVQHGQLEVVKALLEENPNLNATSKITHQTAYSFALENGQIAIAQAIAEKYLENYEVEVNKRDDNDKKASFVFFGKKVSFGCTASQEKEAIKALKKVYIDKTENESSLKEHAYTLRNSELHFIYQKLKAVHDHGKPKTDVTQSIRNAVTISAESIYNKIRLG